MSYLAFDTCRASGSVAVGGPGGPSQVVILPEREEHAARLVPAIDEVLAEAQVGIEDIEGVVVGEGPGSFTGVRIAAATAKALAGALQIPLWAVSSLAAAAVASGVCSVQYVLFDARADRIYGACYEVEASFIRTLIPPHGGVLQEVLEGEVPAGCVFTGDGSIKHRAAIEGYGFGVQPPGAADKSLAEGLLLYMGLDPDSEPVKDMASWEPRYVRVSSVERLWNL